VALTNKIKKWVSLVPAQTPRFSYSVTAPRPTDGSRYRNMRAPMF
jgi:hypothetical protein